VDYWLERFDWRAVERRLNQLPQFIADVEGERIHFIHVRGDGSKPPLLLLHGWPGSFIEFVSGQIRGNRGLMTLARENSIVPWLELAVPNSWVQPV
jgi:hypothetical protein